MLCPHGRSLALICQGMPRLPVRHDPACLPAHLRRGCDHSRRWLLRMGVELTVDSLRYAMSHLGPSCPGASIGWPSLPAAVAVPGLRSAQTPLRTRLWGVFTAPSTSACPRQGDCACHPVVDPLFGEWRFPRIHRRLLHLQGHESGEDIALIFAVRSPPRAAASTPHR